MGLASRGTDAKLRQPGVQQVEPVPGTASPTPGRAGLAEAPCLGHPACTALLPRLPTFPRCHPPLSPPPTRSAPGQCPGPWYKETRDAISLSSLVAWALRVPHYQQWRSSGKVNTASALHQSPPPPPTGLPLILGRLDTDTLAPESCPRALGQNLSLRQRHRQGEGALSNLSKVPWKREAAGLTFDSHYLHQSFWCLQLWCGGVCTPTSLQDSVEYGPRS